MRLPGQLAWPRTDLRYHHDRFPRRKLDFGYPYTSVSDISRRLSDPEWFRYVLELELMAAERPGWAERGTNLMHRFSKVKR